ncbi:MAG: DUF2156 domain-containing protein [Candidatus Merdivicinus sp.]|jgi:hypothetical protein
MLKFRPIELADREMVTRYLREKNYPGDQYSFGNLFIWRKTYHAEICEEQGFLYIKSGDQGNWMFMCPIGQGDLKAAVEKLRAWCKEAGCPLKMYWVPAEDKAKLEVLYPGELTIHSDRNMFDYIYERERLRTLAGRKLQPKRNYVNRIKKKNWSYEPISQENLKECMELQRLWCQEHNRCSEGSAKAESCAVRQAFQHFWDLDFRGGCIRLDGRLVAYTIGEPLNSDTFIVHIEKAFSDVEGAYPLMNQQFVEHAMEGFAYVNREDDTGSEGLRKAKLSYDPYQILEDYIVEFTQV